MVLQLALVITSAGAVLALVAAGTGAAIGLSLTGTALVLALMQCADTSWYWHGVGTGARWH
jgi:hypothetical protein